VKESQLVIGIRPLIEAIQSGKEIDRIWVQKGLKGELAGELLQMLRKKDIPFQYVPVEKLDGITRNNHQGVIARLAEIEYQPLEALVQQVIEEGRNPLIMILDRVTDVRNFGAIARSCECAGADAIVIPSQGGAMINADAIKTSAGALTRIAVCKEKNLMETLEFLRQCGFSVVACTEKGEMSIFDTKLDQPVAIIMGSEENGISKSLLLFADQKAYIPMKGSIASLNVSVAAGIVLFESVRQRSNSVS